MTRWRRRRLSALPLMGRSWALAMSNETWATMPDAPELLIGRRGVLGKRGGAVRRTRDHLVQGSGQCIRSRLRRYPSRFWPSPAGTQRRPIFSVTCENPPARRQADSHRPFVERHRSGQRDPGCRFRVATHRRANGPTRPMRRPESLRPTCRSSTDQGASAARRPSRHAAIVSAKFGESLVVGSSYPRRRLVGVPLGTGVW